MATPKSFTKAQVLACARLLGNEAAARETGVDEQTIFDWQQKLSIARDPKLLDAIADWERRYTDSGQIAVRATVATFIVLDGIKAHATTPVTEDDIEAIDVLSKAAERLHKIARDSREDAAIEPAVRAVLDKVRELQT